ncbi:MAG: serine hydroxymethyltransferase [Chloroflexi bacterium]|nr:serine hydroxymethyltransferase [Chloroflexota bacterium]
MSKAVSDDLSASAVEAAGIDLSRIDPLSELILSAEEARQQAKLVLIPSESACPPAVRRVLGSVFTGLYAEGLPEPRATSAEEESSLELECQLAYYHRYADRRYYQGCDYANLMERLARRRVAELFATDDVPPERIYASVQPLSGAAANNAVYEACLTPGDAMMGMDLTHGGHLTHGSPYNRSGKYFRVTSYGIDPRTGRIDYDAVADLAQRAKPRLIVAGASAYPWDIDWPRLREIADSLPESALLMADIAHPSGLVVAGLFPNPIGYADFVTFTTHKTLIGPRGAVILTTDADLAGRVNRAVFPGEQGGPHMNNIAAMALAFKLAATPEFKVLQEKTVASAQALAAALQKRGLTLAYGGTNTHLLLVDLKTIGRGAAASSWHDYPLKGDIAARILDLCGLVCNKNTIPGDTNAGDSSAIRLGLTWAVQRGLGPEQMDELAGIIHDVITRIEGFRYIGPAGDLPRGKVELGVIEEARGRVQALLESTVNPPLRATPPLRVSLDGADGDAAAAAVAVRESVALLGLIDSGVLRVSGERARAFLQETLTADIIRLKPGQACSSLLLDREGKTIAAPLVLCLESGPAGRARYLLVTDAPERVRSWLNALSDGYVRFDDDILAKIDGPVVVETLDDVLALALRGPRAASVVARLAPGISGMRSGTFEEGSVAGASALVARADEDVDMPSYALLTSRSEARTLWTAARADVEATGGVAISGAMALDGRAPAGRAALSKPYFVGQARLALQSPPQAAPKPAFRFDLPQMEPRPSALYDEHLKLAPRRNMINFAGWLMPVRYTTSGEEHAAVRERAALFDLSHMGVLEFSGDGAVRFLDMVCANYVPWLQVGQSHYSFALDVDGQPMDDIFVYKLALDRYMVVVNAANAEKMEAWFRAVNERRVLIDRQRPWCEVDATCTIRNLKDPSAGADQRVNMAIQGPSSLAILQCSVDNPKAADELCRLKRFSVMEASFSRISAIVARTGYTGEPVGYELYAHPEAAPALWNLLLSKGRDFGMLPAGLGARDSARTEAGLPLYGHELAGPHDISPGGAGYGSFVKLHKPFFIGREAYIAAEDARQSQIVRFRVGATGVRMARQGDPVVNSRGVYIGTVTSSVAVGGVQVGMAYVDRKYAEPGTRIAIFPVSGQAGEREIADPAALSPGRRAMLPLDATVIERFMSPKATEPQVRASS